MTDVSDIGIPKMIIEKIINKQLAIANDMLLAAAAAAAGSTLQSLLEC